MIIIDIIKDSMNVKPPKIFIDLWSDEFRLTYGSEKNIYIMIENNDNHLYKNCHHRHTFKIK